MTAVGRKPPEAGGQMVFPKAITKPSLAVAHARASLHIAQSRLDYTRITTPVAGIVLTRNF